MMGIPRAALLIGVAGLIPFIFGAASAAFPALSALAPGARFSGASLLITYGTVILCFMSGVLWGFAARADRPDWRAYALSVGPALWAFFMVTGGTVQALWALITGFVVLLVLDVQFRAWGLAPPWWLHLRLILSAGVLACLASGLWLV